MEESFVQHPDDQLTEKETEVLRLMALGLTNREIGEKLFLGLETIRWYSKRIYSKLQVRNRMEAATLARQLGWIKNGFSAPYPDKIPGLPLNNLPAQITAFIGRKQELQELSDLIVQKGNRLVTILAAGGMGKTRLAVQVAKANLASFPDGVFFISLEHFESSSQIVMAIADQLNIQINDDQRIDDQLFTYLSDKEILLVLDGYEKLLPENKLVTDLLARIPDLKLLITSRERVNIQGELIYKIKGLQLQRAEDIKNIKESSPIQLFIQGAKLSRPDIEIKDEDLPHISQICKLVEGMPLGILLAAAWIEIMSPEEIAIEISQNIDILETEKTDVPERQKSIRAVFDYSINRLEENDIPSFLKLSVFRGGFTRNAATAIADADMRKLSLFFGKSLLNYDPVEKRYKLHELLRQYAYQKLDEVGKLYDTLARYISFYTGFISQIEKEIKSSNQMEALNRLHADLDNIRFAWNWSIRNNDYEFIDKSLECVYWFCNFRCQKQAGKEMLQKARATFLKNLKDISNPNQLKLIIRFDAAGDEYKNQLEHALKYSKKIQRKNDHAFLLWAYGVNRYVMRDFRAANESLEESLAIFENIQDKFYLIEVLHLLWICNRFLGKTERAEIFLNRALNLSQETGNKFASARALGSGGAFEFLAGNYSKAKEYTEEALIVRREVNDKAGEAMSLAMLGWIASVRGDLKQAKLLADASINIATKANNLNSKMTAINVLGWIACQEGKYTLAKSLCQDNRSGAPDPTVSISATLVLSFASFGLNDLNSSEKFLKEILTFSLSFGGNGLILMCLPIVAYLLSQDHKLLKAVEILAFAFSNSSNKSGWFERSDIVSDLQKKLLVEIGEKDFHLAWDDGKTKSFEDIVKHIQEYF